MKQIISSLLLASIALLFHSSASYAQAPAGFKAGYIVGADGVRIDGFIKESFKSKASLVFQSGDGKKTNYSGNEINEVGIEGVKYSSLLSDFFKVISSGNKVTLYQKVSDASGKVIYSGSDVVGINPGTEGSIGDHFIKIKGADKWILVNKKNFDAVVSTNFSTCSSLLESLKTKAISYQEIEKTVQAYNDCQ